MQKDIKLTWFFNQPPQEVWDYLTKPDLLEKWLMKTDFLPIVGRKFHFSTPENKLIHCEVLKVNPFTELSYLWQANSVGKSKTVVTKVVWTLIPKDNGTELILVHNGFTVIEDYIGHSKGWTTLGNRFVELLNT